MEAKKRNTETSTPSQESEATPLVRSFHVLFVTGFIELDTDAALARVGEIGRHHVAARPDRHQGLYVTEVPADPVFVTVDDEPTGELRAISDALDGVLSVLICIPEDTPTSRESFRSALNHDQGWGHAGDLVEGFGLLVRSLIVDESAMGSEGCTCWIVPELHQQLDRESNEGFSRPLVESAFGYADERVRQPNSSPRWKKVRSTLLEGDPFFDTWNARALAATTAHRDRRIDIGVYDF